MGSPFAGNCSAATNLGTEEIADEEAEVGGAFGEAAHEVGEPVLAVRDVDADAIAVLDEPALQIGAHSIQHLKFEIVLGHLLACRITTPSRDPTRLLHAN